MYVNVSFKIGLFKQKDRALWSYNRRCRIHSIYPYDKCLTHLNISSCLIRLSCSCCMLSVACIATLENDRQKSSFNYPQRISHSKWISQLQLICGRCLLLMISIIRSFSWWLCDLGRLADSWAPVHKQDGPLLLCQSKQQDEKLNFNVMRNILQNHISCGSGCHKCRFKSDFPDQTISPRKWSHSFLEIFFGNVGPKWAWFQFLANIRLD